MDIWVWDAFEELKEGNEGSEGVAQSREGIKMDAGHRIG